MIIYGKLHEFNYNNKIWVIDETVLNLHRNKLKELYRNDLLYILKEEQISESRKSFKHYQEIINFLFDNNISKDCTLIAVGGGVTGDLCGYVASTYMRGINLVHVPTTLLSMVDSSIGGKNGINHALGKNLIGTIYQPINIFIDVEFLNEQVVKDGIVEIIKISLIEESLELYNLLKQSNWELFDSKHKLDIIKMASQLKLKIVSNDINDTKKIREALNLGHTWGHAIEWANNITHGHAVAIGLIKELEFSNEYYNTPSQSVINDIKNLLTQWNIDYKMDVNLKLIEKYITQDKKSNRFVSLEKLGKFIIYNFNWSLLIAHLSDDIVIKSNFYQFKEHMKLPTSKSITNRVLPLSAIAKGNIIINNPLECEDCNLMISALKQSEVVLELTSNSIKKIGNSFNPNGTYYLGNSGTCVRFLVPIFALNTKNTLTITGSEEMYKRPIKPLIDSLSSIGCNIKYLKQEGFLPLEINPVKNLDVNLVKIDGTLSSQYVSGILMGLASLSVNFCKLEWIGEKTSSSFVGMTLEILKKWNMNITIDNDYIIINGELQNPSSYTIEPDATAASYIIAHNILNQQQTTLKTSSLQGDTKINLDMCKYFDNMCIPEIIDLDSSDTFLTWGCLIAMLIDKNKTCEFINIENQNWKECPRIDKFIENLQKCGGQAEKTSTGFKIIKGIDKSIDKIIEIETYKDHRMAMAWSLVSYHLKNIVIKDKNCVNKTFPNYWAFLHYNFNINYTRYIKKSNNIVLIGMPGTGKSFLGKFVSDKLNIPFYDTDELIIKKHNNSISELINMHSWEWFRNEEYLVFQELVKNDNIIISTGGGIIENYKVNNLLEKHTVIYLERNLDMVTKFSKTLSKPWSTLFIERKTIYETLADFIYINNSEPSDFLTFLNVVLQPYSIPSESSFLVLSNLNQLENKETNICSMIEFRGDLLDDEYIQPFIIKYKRHMIYTLRTINEGGKCRTINSNRLELALKRGCKIIDVEISSFNVKIPLITRNNYKIIGSTHSNHPLLAEKDYDILKIVTNNTFVEENLDKLNNININKIIIGNSTKTNDLKLRCTNSYLTPLLSLNELNLSAMINMWDYLNLKHIFTNYKFYFLIGSDIGKSPSSFLHNYVFSKNNLKAKYFNFETDNMEDIDDLLSKNYFAGASITMPFKGKINELIKEPPYIINTIVISNNKKISYNTDIMVIIDLLIKNDNKINIVGSGDMYTIIKRTYENRINRIFDRNNLDTIYNYDMSNEFVIICIPPFIIDTNKIKSNYIIDLSYGLHSKNQNILMNGYQFLVNQAAYQYCVWFNNDNYQTVLNDYNEAFNEYFNKN
jgi:pentafunctional AROM polypeptide